MFVPTFSRFLRIATSLMVLLTNSACDTTSQPRTSAQPTEIVREIPSPEQMQAQVIVSGRVSTLKHIDMLNVDQQIPYTYSAGKITNSQGFQWWVSKHFALKSDLPEDKIKLYLELLELSYPHYVALFGAEPPNIEHQRIAVVYGSSRTRTREAMLDDGFRRGVHDTAGGETMYYNRAGYSFPSSREQHQRYIVIHETMHAFHMALSGYSSWAPNWITEGLADSIAHHVYDPNKKQLAVMVLDRAPMNYVETGLREYAQLNKPSIEEINNNPELHRGLNFFVIHFLLDDPQRAQYFALFRDRLMAEAPHSELTLPVASRLLKEVFPNWSQLEAEFADYVANIRSSFHIAYGPWEQDGNAYWIRSMEQEQMARLDILLPKNRTTASHPLFDFPAPAPSALLDLHKANADLSLGLLINFRPEQISRGSAGLGLGLSLSEHNEAHRQHFQGEERVAEDHYLNINIERGSQLSISGENIKAVYVAHALSQEIRTVLGNKPQLGLTVALYKHELQLELRAGSAQQFISYPLTEALYKQLQKGNITLLANEASHKLTPYIDDGRVYSANDENTAANPWHFTGMGLLQRVFRSCEADPQVSTLCDDTLQLAFTQIQDPKAHEQITAQLTDTEDAIINQLKHKPEESLIASISGISTSLAHNQQGPYLRVVNPTSEVAELSGELVWKGANEEDIKSRPLATLLAQPGVNNIPLEQVDGAQSIELSAVQHWQGLELPYHQIASVLPFDGVQLSSQAESTNDQLIINAQLTGPYSGQSKGTLYFEVLPSNAVVNSRHSEDISFSPYETLHKGHNFILNPDYHGEIETRVKADIEVDGEAIVLNSENQL
jgi:hypothetical protein